MWQNTKYQRAELLARDASVVPPLQYAWVVRVSGQGIVITRYEYIARRPAARSRVDRYAQTWWCRMDGGRVLQRLIGAPVPGLDDELELGGKRQGEQAASSADYDNWKDKFEQVSSRRDAAAPYGWAVPQRPYGVLDQAGRSGQGPTHTSQPGRLRPFM